MAELGHAGGVDGAEVAAAEDGDPHRGSLGARSRDAGAETTVTTHQAVGHDSASAGRTAPIGYDVTAAPRREVPHLQTMSRRPTRDYRLSQLDELEAESIHIFREVAAEFEKPVLMFSGGKDSIVMLRLAEKAFYPAKIPFPVLQVDTGFDFPEVLATRDNWVNRLGVRLIVASRRGGDRQRRRRRRRQDQPQPAADRHPAQRHRGGGLHRRLRWRPPRRGEGPRQGARLLPPRRVRPVGPEDPAPRAVVALQRPHPRRRAHADLPAVELDRARHLALHRPRGDRDPLDLLLPPAPGLRARRHAALRVRDVQPAAAGETVEERTVRFRTVGDLTLTGCVECTAATIAEIIDEIAVARVTERGATRGDDRFSEAAMEDRKKEGYF